MRTGTGSQCRVAAPVRNGDVTFWGSIQFEHQRRAVIKAASGVEGVRTVLDQVRVESAKKNRLAAVRKRTLVPGCYALRNGNTARLRVLVPVSGY